MYSEFEPLLEGGEDGRAVDFEFHEFLGGEVGGLA